MMNKLQYHESKQRGSPDFPLDYHFVDKKHNRYEMPYHWHAEVEILHVLQGTFLLSVGNADHTLHAGDVAYIASGLLHGGTPEECIYECVVFDMRLLLKSNDLCKRYIEDVLLGKVDIYPRFAANSRITRQAVLPMFEALRKHSEGYSLITLGCLFHFVGVTYQTGSYKRNDLPDPGKNKKMLALKRVFEAIETNYTNPPTLKQLSAVVGMTPKYFCRFFREATHRSPMDYIAFYRIELACYAFAATNRNVTEIAMDIGYSDLNYFIRCFKKYKGMTPGRYRRLICGEDRSSLHQTLDAGSYIPS